MRVIRTIGLGASLAVFVAACSDAPTTPRSTAVGAIASANAARAPETPPYNLEVILRGHGLGHVKFTQPRDDQAIIYLDTRVRHLAPNTSYLLQRAADATVDGVCTSTAWLTLGKGLTPQAIVTGHKGAGREELFRDISTIPPGSQFDIQFRVITAATGEVVLESGCYQYTVRHP